MFTELAKGPADAETLRGASAFTSEARVTSSTRWSPWVCSKRRGDRYSNTPETDLFLDRAKPSYIGGILEMANARLYAFWGNLTEGLRTGQPQNEVKTGSDFFGALYADPARLRQFLHAMTGLSMGSAIAIAQKFPWDKYQTFIDIGAAEGGVPVQIALAHDHLTGGGFDLPVVQPIFEEYLASFGLSDRLRFYPGDFFADPFHRPTSS